MYIIDHYNPLVRIMAWLLTPLMICREVEKVADLSTQSAVPVLPKTPYLIKKFV